MASKAEDLTRPRASAAEWVTHRERGSMATLRAMTFLSLRLGRPAARLFLYPIAAYFFTLAPTARRHSRAYLRLALGRKPTAADCFRHILTFATTVHDRVYLLRERFELFDITVAGEDLVRNALEAGNGAFLMGSHVGSFEIVRTIGRRRPGLRVAMAMYEDNARMVNTMLAAINPAAKPEVIPLGHMGAMLQIREYLERGAFVGVLGDRTLGNEATQEVNFLGRKTRFPAGAMRAAAIMRRPVLFMVGLYRGENRYHVAFETLADFSNVEPRQRDAQVKEAIERYARLLEKYVRSDPYNWFNFFDFWRGAADDRR